MCPEKNILNFTYQFRDLVGSGESFSSAFQILTALYQLIILNLAPFMVVRSFQQELWNIIPTTHLVEEKLFLFSMEVVFSFSLISTCLYPHTPGTIIREGTKYYYRLIDIWGKIIWNIKNIEESITYSLHVTSNFCI